MRPLFETKKYRLLTGLVLLSACLIILTVLLTVPRRDASSKGADSSPDATADAEDTLSESVTVASSEAFEGSAASEKEDAPAETLPDTEGLEVIDSYFQYAEGYDWEDIYVLMIELIRTSPDLNGNEPCFSLFTIPGSNARLMAVGYRGDGPENTEYHLYTQDAGFLYELLEFHDTLYYIPSTGKFYIPAEKGAFIYSPHVLLKEAVEELPQDAEEIPVYSLTDSKITSEELYSYLTDYRLGGVK